LIELPGRGHHTGRPDDIGAIRRYVGMALGAFAAALAAELGWPAVPAAVLRAWEDGSVQPSPRVVAAAWRVAGRPSGSVYLSHSYRPADTVDPLVRHIRDVLPNADADTLDLERMVHPDIGTSQLDHFQQFIRLCGQQRRTTSLDALIPAVEATYRRLRELLLDAPARTPTRAYAVAAEAALLAGRLHYFAGRQGDAYAALAFADAVAHEAGADQLRAAARVAMSYLRSPLTRVGEGDPARTMMLLNAATALSSSDVSPLVHAWVLSRRAEEHAARGDELAALHDMDEAGRALGRGDDDTVVTGPRSEADLDGFRGALLIQLGQPGAGDLLERSLASLPEGMLARRAHSLADLAVARAREGAVEAACAALAAAVEAAQPLGRMAYVRRALAVRHRDLARWDGTRAVTELDERIEALR
jgi:hypothetical protein